MTIFLISAAVVLLVLGGAWYAYNTAFYSPVSRRARVDDPLNGSQYDEFAEHISRISGIMASIPCEEVTITAPDGISLRGRYYHVRDGAPIEILFHGYKSHPFRDCSGGHALSRKMGFNALVVDQRGHGESGGRTICFGIKERYDALEWTRYCVDRFGPEPPILLSGLSMGAATVLMASNLPLPGSVCGIIADAPFSAPIAIIEKVGRDSHYPMTLVRPFVYLGALLFGGFHPGEITAKEAVAQSKLPILLLHGEEDHFVPCDMSREMAAHSQDHVRLATFPGAGHGLCYMVDPVRYERVIYRFLESIPALAGTIDPNYVQKLFET